MKGKNKKRKEKEEQEKGKKDSVFFRKLPKGFLDKEKESHKKRERTEGISRKS